MEVEEKSQAVLYTEGGLTETRHGGRLIWRAESEERERVIPK